MQRLKDYARFLAWSSGLGYLALWAMTMWTLDYGTAVFVKSGACRPDVARELFYWVCDPASPLSMLAAAANTALTFTVWAPVYVAAAAVRPDLIVIAAPVAAVHVVGLPAALLVTIRVMVAVLAALRRLLRSARPAPPAAAPVESGAAPQPQSRAGAHVRLARYVRPRETFGLRSREG